MTNGKWGVALWLTLAGAALAADSSALLDYADTKVYASAPNVAGYKTDIDETQAEMSPFGDRSVDELKRSGDAEALAGMHYTLGSDYSYLGDHERALKEFQLAQQLTPVAGQYKSDVASELAALGRPQEADSMYAAALKEAPADQFGIREYAFFKFQSGDYAASQKLALDLLKDGQLSDDDRVYVLLCLYLAAKGLGEDPAVTVRPYLASLPKDAWPVPLLHYLVGLIDEQALLEAIKSRDVQGHLSEALYYIGAQQELAGHKDLAVRYYRGVLRLNFLGYGEYVAAKMALQRLQQG